MGFGRTVRNKVIKAEAGGGKPGLRALRTVRYISKEMGVSYKSGYRKPGTPVQGKRRTWKNVPDNEAQQLARQMGII